MIDTPEHEQILRENEDILYGNGGPTDRVTADKVLAQMRQSRTLCVGLVYSGNGVLGLGGGSTFGACSIIGILIPAKLCFMNWAM